MPREAAKLVFKSPILNSVLTARPIPLLYHYTDQKGLLGIVKGDKKEIWATHHQYLNDTQEYLHAKGLIRDEIELRLGGAEPDARSLLEAMRSALDGPGNEDVNLYVASFSEDGDSLPQWRAYGGFALGFWGDRLVLPKRFTITRCIYRPEEQCEVAKAIVADVLEGTLEKMPVLDLSNAKLTVSVVVRSQLHTFALIFKHRKFKDENEWRIVSPVLMDFKPAYPVEEEINLDFRPGKSMLIPYQRVPLRDERNGFPLHEVVIGPNPNKEQSRRSIESLLRSQGLVATKVLSSEIPYRDW